MHRGQCPGVPGLPVPREEPDALGDSFSCQSRPSPRVPAVSVTSSGTGRGKKCSLLSSSFQVLPSFLPSLGEIHVIKSTIFKAYSSAAFITFHSVMRPPPLPGSKTFSCPQKKTLHPSSPSSLSPAPGRHQPTFSLCGCTYSSNGRNTIIRYVTFCVWLQTPFWGPAFCNSLRKEEQQGPFLLPLCLSLPPAHVALHPLPTESVAQLICSMPFPISCNYPQKRTLMLPRVWKIPWAEEPGRLQSRGSLRVGHDQVRLFMHWRRKWQPTPVFLPGESRGRGSLVGCRLWGHTESDTTEVT